MERELLLQLEREGDLLAKVQGGAILSLEFPSLLVVMCFLLVGRSMYEACCPGCLSETKKKKIEGRGSGARSLSNAKSGATIGSCSGS